MSVLNRQFPPPSDWQAFERLCFDLFRRIWRDPGTQIHGRTGQPQAGVDVYGEDRDDGRLTGVQCKGRDGDYGSTLTEVDFRAEVEKAKKFVPPLQVFIVAMTAQNDVKIQQIAREITADHRKSGLFDVHVHGWNTLKQLISDHRELLQKHYADLAPIDLISRVDDLREEIRFDTRETFRVETTLLASIIRPTSASTGASSDAPEDTLHARIRDAANLTNQGMTHAALNTLCQLREMKVGERDAPQSLPPVCLNGIGKACAGRRSGGNIWVQVSLR
jgi:hypothetical protein